MSAKRSGLGRGLDSLIPKVEKTVEQVKLSELSVSAYQPRKHIDAEHLAELTASIQQKGVLQPLLVRKAGSGYEIVAGERRFRAAQQAGLATVPVVVKDLSDQETLEIAIIENLQREDLNVVDEARAFKQLMDFGLNQEAVAKAVGKSRSAVANTLRLLSLSDAMLESLIAGEITAGHARAILALPEEHREWGYRQILDHDLTVRQAEALKPLVKDKKKRKDVSDGRYTQLESDLSRYVGTRVKVRGGNKGKIELHFYSVDELNRLLEVLGYEA